MVRLPRSMESAAAPAATRHEVVSAANSRTGMNAIHIKGHTGFIPFPASNSAAVERIAMIARSVGRLSTKAIEVSPEGTLVKQTELFFALGQATTQIEHDESMRECAEFEGNLYRIVRTQFASAHCVLKNVYDRIERRRAPRLEISGINPRPLTRHKKHKLVEVRELQRGVKKDVRHLHQPVLHAAFELQSLNPGREFIEALVGNRIQQAGPVRIVAIDGHRSNTDPFRDGTHRNCRKAFTVKKLSRRHKNRSSSAFLWWSRLGRSVHEYTAYTYSVYAVYVMCLQA